MQGRPLSRDMRGGFDSRRQVVNNGMSRGKVSTGRNHQLITSSYYNDSREPSPYRGLNEQRSRGNYGMMQRGVHQGQYRDLSKNSRASGHSIRGTYGIKSPSVRVRV